MKEKSKECLLLQTKAFFGQTFQTAKHKWTSPQTSLHQGSRVLKNRLHIQRKTTHASIVAKLYILGAGRQQLLEGSLGLSFKSMQNTGNAFPKRQTLNIEPSAGCCIIMRQQQLKTISQKRRAFSSRVSKFRLKDSLHVKRWKEPPHREQPK